MNMPVNDPIKDSALLAAEWMRQEREAANQACMFLMQAARGEVPHYITEENPWNPTPVTSPPSAIAADSTSNQETPSSTVRTEPTGTATATGTPSTPAPEPGS